MKMSKKMIFVLILSFAISVGIPGYADYTEYAEDDEWIMPETLDEYIEAFDYSMLGNSKNSFEIEYNKLYSAYINESISEDQLYDRISALEVKLRDSGVYMPF